MVNYIDVVVLLLLPLFLGVALPFCSADSWRYPTPGPDGNVGPPENWGGSCDAGLRQSPIDINYKAAVKGAYPEFTFHNYDSLLVNASLVNTGHTVQINLGDESTSIYGGGLRSKYVLEQLHFHWGSEHTIDDGRYALELHLVHRHSQYSSVSEASTAKGGIAVLAVLFHVDEHPNVAIEKILNSTEPVKGKVNNLTSLHGAVHLEQLLPKERKVYFRYEGSLTTPVCAESVVWTVFPESIPVSLAQVEDFRTVHDQDDRELLLNYRQVQPLNSRVLVLVADTELVESGSTPVRSSTVPIAFSTILSVVIFYFKL